MRCSLVNEYPPPTFGPIACVGSKFTRKSTHPRTSFVWLMEPLVEFEDYCKKLGTFKRHHSVDVHSKCDTHCEHYHVHGDNAFQSVMYHQGLTSKPMVIPLYDIFIQLSY